MFTVLEEPNFKVYTDTDTPSGDASLLREGQEHSNSTLGHLNSTQIEHGEVLTRPEPNISIIPPQATTQEDSSMDCSSTSQLGLSCDLCGLAVKGQAYLTQHRNKKKCLERQKVQRETQHQLEVSLARMGSLRVSESDATDTSDPSKVL